MKHFEDWTHLSMDIIIDYDDQHDLYYGSVRNELGQYIYCADSNEYLTALISCFNFIDKGLITYEQ